MQAFQKYISGLYPEMSALVNVLPTSDRQEFFTHYSKQIIHFLNIMPKETLELVIHLLDQGQLRIVSGLTDIEKTDQQFTLTANNVWGSKFAIGIYLGIIIGLLGGQSLTEIFELAFTAAFCLQLFSIIGSWFIESVEPLSQGITNFANKRFEGRQFNIGLDWPFIAGRAEMWAAANVLAPIMLVIALVLPGNKILPLGGIIAMGLTPSLLIVTRGKIMRMIVIGIFMLPVFLWAGTLIAPAVTDMAINVGAFPDGLAAGSLITHSTLEGPIEKFVAYLVGTANVGNIMSIVYLVLASVAYLGLFAWYAKQMKKRNAEYLAKEQEQQ